MLYQTIPTAQPSPAAHAPHLRTPTSTARINDPDAARALRPSAPPLNPSYGLLITIGAPLPAPSTAAVAGTASAGPLLGPPARGMAADHFSVVAICVTLVLIVAIAGFVLWRVGIAGAGKTTKVGLEATGKLDLAGLGRGEKPPAGPSERTEGGTTLGGAM